MKRVVTADQLGNSNYILLDPLDEGSVVEIVEIRHGRPTEITAWRPMKGFITATVEPDQEIHRVRT